MIKVQALSKTFNHRQVVAKLSFEAPNGAITGLLGANGAGKSTTLRMICGALQPQSGSVAIDDLPESTPALDRRRRIGALLDHMGLYSRLTVRENLLYFGRLQGIPSATLAERVETVISLLRLESVADRRTAGFSQGERMKTALARALLHNPRNLLLDEPTNGLDIPTVRSLRELLRRLRDAGVCIVYSSHVLDEVRALCDYVVIIAAGQRIAHGSPGEICALAQTESLEDAFIALTSREAAHAH
jgi:sodium transport system ATP-binding protein